MKLNSMKEVNEFKQVIDACEGKIWMVDSLGSRYDLTSEITQFVVLAELVKNPENDLELFADHREDEYRLLEFLKKQHQSQAAA